MFSSGKALKIDPILTSIPNRSKANALIIDRSDKIFFITDTLGGIVFMAFPIGYFLTIRFTGRGGIELNTIFLQEIVEQSRVPLM
jgi:hypothetical protein